jgi:hypothetical protein
VLFTAAVLLDRQTGMGRRADGRRRVDPRV